MSTIAEVKASVNAKGKAVFTKENATFTRAKGGTAEREEPINGIEVPDLWHIAMALNAGSQRVEAFKNGEFVSMLAGDYVLECWHLAHDMKRHIQTNS